MQHFKDYFWKGGTPCGIGVAPQDFLETYKIISDPYRKRISIEKYSSGVFDSVIYDSILLDFRHLRTLEQAAWQKIILSETTEKVVCLIRNQDDRALFLETHQFENGLCRQCQIHSAHGQPLSVHRMFYMALGDPFNGVILFDQNAHPVMQKKYNVNPDSGAFTQLLEEDWG